MTLNQVPPAPGPPSASHDGAPGPPWRLASAWAAVACAIVLAVGLGLLASALGSAFGWSFDDPPAGLQLAATFLQDAGIIAVVLVLAHRVTHAVSTALRLRPTAFWPALAGIGLAFASFVAVSAGWLALVGGHGRDRLVEDLGGGGVAVTLGGALLVAVVAPVAEELLFRGYLFPALRARTGTWAGALVTGVVFGAVHAAGTDARYLLPLAFFGVALCLLYAWTGSLYPCIALHAANNTIAYGAGEHWSWQTPLVLGSAVGTLALVATALRARQPSAD
jgi:membrane protease YdiL (CAAX protease family)